MKVPLSSPDITNLEKKYVDNVLSTPNLSLGPMLEKFEVRFAEYIGSKYAIAVNSGTSGLHLCVRSLGIQDGDNVLTTPFSFISSANCILFERARPVFVDIDSRSYNIDCNQLEHKLKEIKRNHQKAKAILPVHVFGRPCEMRQIMELARLYDLDVIEDACEALGATYGGKKVGLFGRMGVFAFYPNKQMTTGEGGIIVTDDKNLASLCKSMRNQGRGESGEWLAHERLGYNYRLSDINCALGIAQLERLEEILEKRERVASMYGECLKDLKGIHVPNEDVNAKISWFVYVIRLSDDYSEEHRDEIIKYLRSADIGCNNYFAPIHLQPFYRELFLYKKGDFPVTEHVSSRTIALPFYNNLKKDQVEYVVEHLMKILRKY